MPYIA